MQLSNFDTFGEYLRKELLHEWWRFFWIEFATGGLVLIGFLLSLSGHRVEWMPAWDAFSSFIGAVVIGVALHVFFGFSFAWLKFIEDRLGLFQAELCDFKGEIAGNFLTISEQLRLPTGLSNDALDSLSKYLSDADKLYSVVYVRPSLWLRLGDLMNVFSLQAFYHHRRLEEKRPLVMIRFLIWNRDEFLSPAGIFIIRASILVGAQTKIITKSNIKEVIRKYGAPSLERLVDRNLHVWLDCKIRNRVERPQSGSYGELTEKGFAEPHSMRKEANVDESEQNFFQLVKLLEEFSVELKAPDIPNQIKESNLKDQVTHALRELHTERQLREITSGSRRGRPTDTPPAS